MPQEPVLSRSQQQQFERRLLKLREHLTGQYEGLAAHTRTSQGESLSELSTYDNHPGDIGTETFQRSRDWATQQLTAQRLQRVEDALARIRAGLYGKCAHCGRTIPAARLEAVPETIYCLQCAQLRLTSAPTDKGGRRRPVEEELLRPALARIYGSAEDKRVGYDEEDAWQDVARYGTSSTSPGLPEVDGIDDAGDEDDN